jgi:putative transposase
VRPATALICQFIDQKKQEFGVAPICRVLSEHGTQIAPRTYWARLNAAPGKRELWDIAVTEILAGIYEPDEQGRRPPESLYGTVKMWAHLNRQGILVARCTVGRLKRAHGWQGATRGRRARTTVPDPAAARAPDLVRRNFKAARPGQLHVADFTYVPLASGRFAYAAFVVDAFAGLIPGWECSLSKKTAFVESAIRQATAYRARHGHPISGDAIHHSDAGSQGGFNRSSQHLDHGGVRWDAVGSNCRTRRRVHVGSGRRIGRCGRRCGHRAGLSPRVRCSGSSGG